MRQRLYGREAANFARYRAELKDLRHRGQGVWVLWQHYQEHHDAKTEAFLFRHYAGLVLHVAHKFRVRLPATHPDLVQEGNLGLLKAIRRYDLTHRHRAAFNHYSREFIYQHMRVYMARALAVVHHNRRTPLSVILDTEHRVEVLPIDVDSAPSPEELVIAHDEQVHAKALVRLALRYLTPRERLIVKARLLAEDDARQTFREIGVRLGVSPERARQLGARAERKLHHALRILKRADH